MSKPLKCAADFFKTCEVNFSWPFETSKYVDRISEWARLVSGMGISSFQGLKKHPKISPREKNDRQDFPFNRLILRFFLNPWDGEISISETHDPFRNMFLLELTMQFCTLTAVI